MLPWRLSRIYRTCQVVSETMYATLVSRTNSLAKTTSGPLPHLTAILNSHLETIQWLDANLNKLSTEAKEVSKLGDRVQLEMSRREL